MRTDPEIRSVLLPQLRAERPDALLVQEWGINFNLVADVAAVNVDLVEAWEIKSASDSTARLPKQVPLYSKLFDRCALVTAPNHLKSVRQAVVPAWWGLVVVLSEGDLVVERPAQPNPGPYNVACLLWAIEMNQVLRKLTGKPSRQGKTPAAAALDKFPREQVAPLVCATLRARQEWRAPDGTSAKREERRQIRQDNAESIRKSQESQARWMARAAERLAGGEK